MRIFSVYSSRLKTSLNKHLCLSLYEILPTVWCHFQTIHCLFHHGFQLLHLPCFLCFKLLSPQIFCKDPVNFPLFSLMMHGLFTCSSSSFTSWLSALSEVCHTREATSDPDQDLYSSPHPRSLSGSRPPVCWGISSSQCQRGSPQHGENSVAQSSSSSTQFWAGTGCFCIPASLAAAISPLIFFLHRENSGENYRDTQDGISVRCNSI